MLDFNKISKLNYFIGLSFFGAFIIIIAIISDCVRHDKLKQTENKEAVLTEMGGDVHYGTYVRVDYFVKDEKLNSRLHCNCPELNVGDTILIRYSLKDPSTIALVKKFYMEKYKKY